MADELAHLVVYTMAISDDEEGGIVFLHRVLPGSLGRSYGVHVAKLAGMPTNIVRRAEAVLQQLENNSQSKIAQITRTQQDNLSYLDQQGYPQHKLVAESSHNYSWQSTEARQAAAALEQSADEALDLSAINLSAITPLDALNLLFIQQQKKRSVVKR
jgi:DNA mismatch repair protein MutS